MRPLLFILLLSTVYSELTISIEGPPTLAPLTVDHHHHHRQKHRRDHSTAPYRAAASTTIASDGTQERFSLNCPHVTDAANKDVKLEVTWTLDDTVWLKVRDGEELVGMQQTSFNRKRMGGKSVVQVGLNRGRYVFNYDELTGDFAMEINPVIPAEDFGMWECHVTMKRYHTTHTLTSRSRIKGPPGVVRTPDGEIVTRADLPRMTTLGYRTPQHEGAHRRAYPPARIQYGSRDTVAIEDYRTDSVTDREIKFSSFDRTDKQSSLQINRDSDKRKATITFNRPVTKSPHLARIDYELDLADGDEDFRYDQHHTRVRAASGVDGVSTGASLVSLSAALFIVLLGN